MMVRFFIAILWSFCSPNAWSADNFGGQTEFQATPLRGQVYITCHSSTGERDFAQVYCQDLVLEPFEYAYFYTDQGVDADSVSLKSVWENGVERKKVVGFDPATGRSRSRVNLWIETALQRALLALGTNQISYKLKKDGVEVKRGQFEAQVVRGEAVRCRTAHYTSRDQNDCRVPQRICHRYFSENGACK